MSLETLKKSLVTLDHSLNMLEDVIDRRAAHDSQNTNHDVNREEMAQKLDEIILKVSDVLKT